MAPGSDVTATCCTRRNSTSGTASWSVVRPGGVTAAGTASVAARREARTWRPTPNTPEERVTMQYRIATAEDYPMLAELNSQLIRDEGYRNPMTSAQLEERLRGWLTSGE